MFSFFFQDGGSAMFLALCDVMMGVILKKRHSLSRMGKRWSNLENFSVTRIMDGTALHN